MSHVVTFKLQVKDLDALERACGRLGLELIRGKKTFKWYGRWVNDYHATDAAYQQGIKTSDYGKCEHAIAVKGNSGAYEIGVMQDKDGGYRLVWDFFGGGYGLCEKISYTAGKDAQKLEDWYQAEVTAQHLAEQGYYVEPKQGQEQVELICSK